MLNLPWELLHDGTTVRDQRPNRRVVTARTVPAAGRDHSPATPPDPRRRHGHRPRRGRRGGADDPNRRRRREGCARHRRGTSRRAGELRGPWLDNRTVPFDILHRGHGRFDTNAGAPVSTMDGWRRERCRAAMGAPVHRVREARESAAAAGRRLVSGGRASTSRRLPGKRRPGLHRSSGRSATSTRRSSLAASAKCCSITRNIGEPCAKGAGRQRCSRAQRPHRRRRPSSATRERPGADPRWRTETRQTMNELSCWATH